MDVSKIPYAAWLEETIQKLVQSPAKHIAIVSLNSDQTVGTAYWMCDSQDKAVIAHHIQVDIIMDIIGVNADHIKAMLDDADEMGEETS